MSAPCCLHCITSSVGCRAVGGLHKRFRKSRLGRWMRKASCPYQVKVVGRKCLHLIAHFKGMLARTMFLLHALVCISRLVDFMNDPLFWWLLLSCAGIFLEAIVTTVFNDGGDWNWFSSSIFFYITSVIPTIWYMEIYSCLARDDKLRVAAFEEDGRSFHHESGLDIDSELDSVKMIEPQQWKKVLQQLLLLILIVGRWLMPKGTLTSNQKSQLLLVNIGMAADILELLEAFNEPVVQNNMVLVNVIMLLWSISLMQFALTFAGPNDRKNSVDLNGGIEVKERRGILSCPCCETEIWAILSSLMMQDCPFLTIRLVLIIGFNVRSYGNVFFTAKNSLVIALQLYRMCVIVMVRSEADETEDTIVVKETFGLALLRVRRTQTMSPPPSPLPTGSASAPFLKSSGARVEDEQLEVDISEESAVDIATDSLMIRDYSLKK